MRIGFDAKRAFNNRRGLGNYSRETLRILTTLAPEHQYYLFTPRIDPGIGFECPDGARLVTTQARGTWPQSLWRTFGIAKEAKRLELEVYHGLSHELPFGIEKTGIRTVLTMHDLMFLSHPGFFSHFDRTMYRKKYLHSCRVADRIVAISEQTRRDLLEWTDTPNEKIEVVYQGCHPRFRQPITEEAKQQFREHHHLPEAYLLNVAAFEPRKNQLILLKALETRRFDIPLVIAGQKTPYLETLRQYAREHGLEHRICWLPNLPGEALPALYQSATAFAFPSLYEGFGIPVVEALASGLPVIAATGSCLEESGGPDSLYCSPTDETEWAERIAEVVENEAKRNTMIQQGLAYSERFSDQAIHRKLIQIYQNLIP